MREKLLPSLEKKKKSTLKEAHYDLWQKEGVGIQRWEELHQDSATGRSLWPDLARERHQEEAAQGGCREN